MSVICPKYSTVESGDYSASAVRFYLPCDVFMPMSISIVSQRFSVSVWQPRINELCFQKHAESLVNMTYIDEGLQILIQTCKIIFPFLVVCDQALLLLQQNLPL